MGISKGMEIGPTVSGGIGRSGKHGRPGESPANKHTGAAINTIKPITIMTASRTLMTTPQSMAATKHKAEN